MNARLPRLAPAAPVADQAADDLAQAFAQLMRDLHQELGGAIADADTVALAAWHASRAASSEHSCIDVRGVATADAAADFADDVAAPWRQASLIPDANAGRAWLAALARSPVVALAENRNAQSASSDTFRPLVLDHGGLLYLYRYWDYERRLAARLLELDCAARLGSDEARAQLLRQLFGEAPAAPAERNDSPASIAHPDQQRSAAATALTRRLCIISGGPGTGKTTTVVKILAMLLSLAPELRIALAAPTGKAAARMRESIRNQLADLRVAEDVKRRLPGEAFTVHRLLGYIPGKVQFRHHRERPLNCDVVVVDEASMLDLALAAKLLDALPGHGRLILLGDKDQLASVETGAVFAEICAARESSGAPETHASGSPEASSKETIDSSTHDRGLADSVIWLTHSYRFSAAGGIGKLARCVNNGDAGAALAYLADSVAISAAGLRWEEVVPKASALAGTLIEGYQAYIDAIRDAIHGDAIRGEAAPAAVLAAFERYRVLCAVREGEQGAAELNACIGERFRAALAQDRSSSEWFPGRPVLVTRNDYVVKVFNGDVGVALPAPGNELLVHFPAGDGGTRTVAPARLPDCETAFAMTIHKAQGSEFDGIDIVLPVRDNRLLARELLYTALTRARTQVRLWALADVVKAAIERRTRRYSGLALRLRNRTNDIRDGKVQ